MLEIISKNINLINDLIWLFCGTETNQGTGISISMLQLPFVCNVDYVFSVLNISYLCVFVD